VDTDKYTCHTEKLGLSKLSTTYTNWQIRGRVSRLQGSTLTRAQVAGFQDSRVFQLPRFEDYMVPRCSKILPDTTPPRD